MTENIEALKARRLDEARRRLEGTMDSSKVEVGQWRNLRGNPFQVRRAGEPGYFWIGAFEDGPEFESQHHESKLRHPLCTTSEVITAYLASLPEEQRARVTMRDGHFDMLFVSVDGETACDDRTHSVDAMLYLLRSALAKPPASKPEPKPKTRTEAIRERYAGNDRVTFEQDDDTGSWCAFVDGKMACCWPPMWDHCCSEPNGETACGIIDAALAKTAPVVEPSLTDSISDAQIDTLLDHVAEISLTRGLYGQRIERTVKRLLEVARAKTAPVVERERPAIACACGGAGRCAACLYAAIGDEQRVTASLRAQLATVTAERDEARAKMDAVRKAVG